MGIRVYGYDYFEPLVDFWQWLLKDPAKLADDVAKYKPVNFSEPEFKKLKKKHPKTKSSFKKAVEFYVLNRTSHSGNPTAVGMAKKYTRRENGTVNVDKNLKPIIKKKVNQVNNEKHKNKFKTRKDAYHFEKQ